MTLRTRSDVSIVSDMTNVKQPDILFDGLYELLNLKLKSKLEAYKNLAIE